MKVVASLVVAAFFSLSAFAQTATLRGQVTDETGAVVPGAKVTLSSAAGPARAATTSSDGTYVFTGLDAGSYTVEVTAPDLTLPQPAKITLKAGTQTLSLQLKVASLKQQLTVHESGAPGVTPEASNNAGALVLRGQELEALSDDPDDLQADLQALAGPSAGPNGGSIFVDGFSGGQLPPKSSIREVRVNQNPFSPEYDRLGFGRIEVFTKPGTDKFHGSGFYNFAGDFWNSRSPYAQQKAPFLLKEYGGNLGGSLGRRASFFLDIQRHSIDNGAVISAVTLDPATLAVINPFTGVFRVPQRRVMASPRVDYQLSSKHTLMFRYGFTRSDIRDAGIGNFNLVERGYHTTTTFQTVQLTDTAVLAASVVNETRFQFFRARTEMLANAANPALEVLGSFNGGAAPIGHEFDTQNNYELQNYTSVARGGHTWRFGARLREQLVDNVSPQNFAGTFTFGGGTGPLLDANNQPIVDAAGQPALVPITSIEQYRRTLLFQRLGYTAARIRALGGGATQFSLNAGNPAISALQFDLGVFAGDDWRMRPNMTLSLGLRYETQTNIHDWRDFAPRFGFAWAPRATAKTPRPKTVVRAGFGIFYDRFALANTLTARRYNGVVQHQYVIDNPDFYPVAPPVASLGYQSMTAIQEISSSLRAPYVMQSAASFERQLPANTTVAITYANSHGLHMLRSTDINAPLPGTYNSLAPSSAVYPFGTPGPIFLMESSGLYNQNQWIVNANSRLNPNVSLFASYTLNRARSNTDDLGTFPANPYDYAGEYGPASTDIRHRVSFGGSINTRWNVRLNPLVTIESGPPFDITAGTDLYGTTLFNGRPGVATNAAKPGLIETSYGLLDPNPTPDERILPRNSGRGPGQIMVNLRLSKTFAFGATREGAGSTPAGSPGQPGGGPRPSGGGPFGAGGLQSVFSSPPANRRYNLTIAMSTRNLLNHTNPGPIIGNITSPLFALANQMAGGPSGNGGFAENANNRRLELQCRFTF